MKTSIHVTKAAGYVLIGAWEGNRDIARAHVLLIDGVMSRGARGVLILGPGGQIATCEDTSGSFRAAVPLAEWDAAVSKFGKGDLP